MLTFGSASPAWECRPEYDSLWQPAHDRSDRIHAGGSALYECSGPDRSELPGIDPETNDGATALIIAAKQGHTDIVQLLKKAGAKK